MISRFNRCCSPPLARQTPFSNSRTVASGTRFKPLSGRVPEPRNVRPALAFSCSVQLPFAQRIDTSDNLSLRRTDTNRSDTVRLSSWTRVSSPGEHRAELRTFDPHPASLPSHPPPCPSLLAFKPLGSPSSLRGDLRRCFGRVPSSLHLG